MNASTVSAITAPPGFGLRERICRIRLKRPVPSAPCVERRTLMTTPTNMSRPRTSSRKSNASIRSTSLGDSRFRSLLFPCLEALTHVMRNAISPAYFHKVQTGKTPHQRVLFSQTRNRWRVMSNSPYRALSISQLSPRSSRWPRPTKAVGRAERHACIQHTLPDRVSTGKQGDLTLERWWPSGAGQHASHFRYRRETSTSTSSFARHERTDDVTPSDAVCDDV
jgi:hypothetical protein